MHFLIYYYYYFNCLEKKYDIQFIIIHKLCLFICIIDKRQKKKIKWKENVTDRKKKKKKLK